MDGGRVKKVSGSTTTYTFFGHYEEEVTDGVTTAISHYSFGGLRIAVKRGSTLYHLHGDHLGSTSLTTAGSAVEAHRTYYAYGAERSATGDLRTDHTFTGQKRDATGLMYYNARYYDPALGTFISPDSMVPGAGQVINYNRFLYARGNPLKYRDPSGHASAKAIREWEEKNSWYNAHGWFWGGDHWDIKGASVIKTKQNARDVLATAGIEPDNNFSDDELKLLAKGISAFAKRIEEIPNHRKVNGLTQIDNLVDGKEKVKWHRTGSGSGLCSISIPHVPPACAWHKGAVEFYDKLFDGSYTDDAIAAMAVHEMAHVIHLEPFFKSQCKGAGPRCDIAKQAKVFLKNKNALTSYAAGPTWWVEYWAEAVGIWVFEDNYPRTPSDLLQRE